MKNRTLSVAAATMIAFGTSIGFSNLEVGSPTHNSKRKRDDLPEDIQNEKIRKAIEKRRRKESDV